MGEAALEDGRVGDRSGECPDGGSPDGSANSRGGLDGVSGGGAGSVLVTRNMLREKRTYPEGSALSKSVLFCHPSSGLMLGPLVRSFMGMLLLR